jgi:uncharacterized protein (DUF433 family)
MTPDCGHLRYNDAAMMKLELTQTVPLTLTDEGTIRVTGSRVSLDSIIHHYRLGATAEQIACKFQGVQLADIYSAIAYYLTHREAVEDYLRHQEARGDALQQQLESDEDYQATTRRMRERLLARQARQEPEVGPTATE